VKRATTTLRSGYCEGLKKDQIAKIARLTGCENFVGKREKFIVSMSVGLKQTVPKCLVSSQVIEKALSAVDIFSWPLTALAIAQQLVTIAQRRRCHDR